MIYGKQDSTCSACGGSGEGERERTLEEFLQSVTVDADDCEINEAAKEFDHLMDDINSDVCDIVFALCALYTSSDSKAKHKIIKDVEDFLREMR